MVNKKFNFGDAYISNTLMSNHMITIVLCVMFYLVAICYENKHECEKHVAKIVLCTVFQYGAVQYKVMERYNKDQMIVD